MDKHDFQSLIWDYYQTHGRSLPWRQLGNDETATTYKVLVSEMMLQQTQVSRVVPKYEQFMSTFPTMKALADASLAEVLTAWSGLGYNRRAKYLHDAAKQLLGKSHPWQVEDLVACKGIGHNTAAAICVYSYNQPIAFIETNIRTVFIHCFFSNHTAVPDKELLPTVQAFLDQEHPREFYWAIMDYGTHLKQTIGNISRNSKHYVKQSTFEGSNRFIRGKVLKELATHSLSQEDLSSLIKDERLAPVVKTLKREGLVTERQGILHLGS